MERALQRELLEEIGCEANVVSDVGEIVEYGDKWKMKQISHCYLARQAGVQQSSRFTQKEMDEGFEVVWADTIQAAIELLNQDEPNNYDGLFIQKRDSTLLGQAEKLLGDQPSSFDTL
jgi:8-oxo-dGTP diphosphatase